jgi:hypothetical protein
MNADGHGSTFLSPLEDGPPRASGLLSEPQYYAGELASYAALALWTGCTSAMDRQKSSTGKQVLAVLQATNGHGRPRRAAPTKRGPLT